MSSVGSKIRELRKDRGMSLDDLARKIGTNRSTVMRYESGRIDPIPALRLVALAQALSTTVAYLTDDNVGYVSGINDVEYRAHGIDIERYGQLENILNRLSADGIEKLYAYAEDLLASGKYNR